MKMNNNNNMEMMMQHHLNLYKLHSELANEHYHISQIQMQIANENYKMYMRMMHEMQDQRQDCCNLNQPR